MDGLATSATPFAGASEESLGALFEPRGFEIFEQSLASAFAAVAAFAIPPKPHAASNMFVQFDPDDASLQLRRNVQRNIDTFAPNAGGQSVRGVVCEFDRFFRRAEGHRGEDRTKDLLLRDDRSRCTLLRNVGL